MIKFIFLSLLITITCAQFCTGPTSTAVGPGGCRYLGTTDTNSAYGDPNDARESFQNDALALGISFAVNTLNAGAATYPGCCGSGNPSFSTDPANNGLSAAQQVTITAVSNMLIGGFNSDPIGPTDGEVWELEAQVDGGSAQLTFGANLQAFGFWIVEPVVPITVQFNFASGTTDGPFSIPVGSSTTAVFIGTIPPTGTTLASVTITGDYVDGGDWFYLDNFYTPGCPPGQGGTSGNFPCVACVAGQFNSLNDLSACQNCLLGNGCTACSQTTGECTACPAGFFTSGTGCNACTLGNGCTACDQFTGACTSCPPGLEISGTGCSACSSGSFKPVSGAAGCGACALFPGPCTACDSITGDCTVCSSISFITSGTGCITAVPANPVLCSCQSGDYVCNDGSTTEDYYWC